jgi:mono/diheme cytochrome c family protein
MPSLSLTATEAIAIADGLIGDSAPVAAKEVRVADDDAVTRGLRLANEARCGACHEDAPRPAAEGVPALDALRFERSAGSCLGPPGPARRLGVPDYALDEEERDAIEAFLREARAWTRPRVEPPIEYVARRRHELRCAACHELDGEIDAWTRFDRPASKSSVRPSSSASDTSSTPPALDDGTLGQRPDLTHAGARLRPSALAAILADPAGHRARPWLAARMPRFGALDAARAASGFAAEHGLARFESPRVHSSQPAEPQGEALAAGARLSEADGGLACVTCHDSGVRRATAPFDARGPDLSRIAPRIREEWFFRWMRDPQRLRPGTKMPQFAPDGRSAAPGILDGDAERQFRALWEWLESNAQRPR